jgi:hypothetical protein
MFSFNHIKHFIFSAVVLSVAVPAVAQDTALFRTVATEQELIRQYTKTSSDLLYSPLPSFNNVLLQGHYKNGEFRLPQEEQRNRSVLLRTEGQTQWHGIAFYGLFSYHRQWRDSVAWTQRVNLHDPNPYYILNEKAGNWDQAQYRLKGLLAAPIGKNLTLGAGINYEVGDASRYNDPRTGITLYDMLLEGNVGWKVSPAVGISASGTYGWGSDKSLTRYSFDQNVSLKEYIMYEMMGYGHFNYAPTLRLKSWSRSYSTGLNFYVNTGSNNIRGELKYRYQKDSTNHLTSTNEQNHLGKFYQDNWEMAFSWLKNLNNNRKAFLTFEGNFDKGHDQNDSLGGNNYRYQKYITAVTAGYYKRTSSLNKSGWSGRFSYTDLQKLDGTSEHSFHASYVEGHIQREQSFVLNETNAILTTLQLGGRADVGSKLEVPSQQVTFITKAIAFPEIRYYQESAITASAKIGWLRQLNKTSQAEFSIQPGITLPVNTNTPPAVDAKFDPNGNRFFINCNLQFYF